MYYIDGRVTMENKTEKQAREWLVTTMGLRKEDITKSKGTPDFLTPIGGFEVKKLYGDKIIFYSDQLEILARYPDVTILIFNGDGHFVRKATYPDIDLERGALGDIKVINTQMTSIQVSKELVAKLQSLGKWGDTYSTIIRRLLDEQYPEQSKGDQYEDRGDKTDESTGISDQDKG